MRARAKYQRSESDWHAEALKALTSTELQAECEGSRAWSQAMPSPKQTAAKTMAVFTRGGLERVVPMVEWYCPASPRSVSDRLAGANPVSPHPLSARAWWVYLVSEVVPKT